MVHPLREEVRLFGHGGEEVEVTLLVYPGVGSPGIWPIRALLEGSRPTGGGCGLKKGLGT